MGPPFNEKELRVSDNVYETGDDVCKEAECVAKLRIAREHRYCGGRDIEAMGSFCALAYPLVLIFQ